jgi:hypothetical protein
VRRCDRFIAIRVTIVLSIVLGGVLGCHRDDRLPTARVTGIITLDAKPLAFGSVIFEPIGGQRLAKGHIQADGSYELGTYAQKDGAVLGPHRVAVIAREPLPADAPRNPVNPHVGRSAIPEFYNDTARSGLTFEVKSDGPNVFDIRLSSSAKPKQP